MSLKQVYIKFDQWLVSQGIEDVKVEFKDHSSFFSENETVSGMRTHEIGNVVGHNVTFTFNNTVEVLRVISGDKQDNNLRDTFAKMWLDTYENLISLDDLRPISSGVYSASSLYLFWKYNNKLYLLNESPYNRVMVLLSIRAGVRNYVNSRQINASEAKDSDIRIDDCYFRVEGHSGAPFLIRHTTSSDDGFTIPNVDIWKQYVNQLLESSNTSRDELRDLERVLYINDVRLKEELLFETYKSYISNHDVFIVTQNEIFKVLNKHAVKVEEGYILPWEKVKYFTDKRGIKWVKYKNMDDVVTIKDDNTIIDNLNTLEQKGLSIVVDEYLRYTRRVNDYSFRPQNDLKLYDGILHDNNDNNKYFGVEIEIGDGGRDEKNAQIIVQTLTKGIPSAYVTYDSSVNRGFEIKTIPVGYNDAINLDWDEAFGIADELGYTGENDSCGIHIHVSKQWFQAGINKLPLVQFRNNSTDYTLYSVVAHVINRIMANNWADVLAFTRREYSKLKQWANDDIIQQTNVAQELLQTQNTKFFERVTGDYYNARQNKYTALNVRKDSTFEFRIFRGTINPQELRDIVRFVHNITNIAKNMTIDIISNVNNTTVWPTIYDRIEAITMNDLLREDR